MKVWATVGMLILCFSVSQQATEDCVKVSTELEEELSVIAGLDSAFALAANCPSLALCLASSEVPFTLDTVSAVNTKVSVHGNGQIIIFLKSLMVRGILSIFNSSLTASFTSAEFSLISLARGSLRIEDSSITAVSAALAAGSGSVVFKGSNFTNNVAPIVLIAYQEDLSVSLLQCDVWKHTGEFLGVTALFTSGNISVFIEQTTFRENGGVGFLLSFSIPLLSGKFTISEAEFLGNTIPLFYFDIRGFQVSMTRCKFADNSQTTAIVNANEAVFTLEDSLWSGNSDIVFDFRQFTGDLLVSRITVSDQQWKGIFQLNNNLSPEECRFTVQGSSFLDTYFKVNEPSPGLIHAFSCIVELTQAVVNNVRMAAARQRDLEALVILRFGRLVVSQMTLSNSGTVGLGIGTAYGEFLITDSLLDDLQSGGMPLLSFFGSITVQNVDIVQFSLFPVDGPGIGASSFYMSASSSNLKILNVRILPAKRFYRDNIIFSAFSTIDIRGVTMYGQRAASIVYLIDSKGLILNVAAFNCVFDYSIFYLNNKDLVQISEVTVRDSSIGLENVEGLFGGTPKLNADCANLRIHNVTGNYLAASKQAFLHLRNITISDCQFVYFLKNQLDSNITIENMVVRRSTTVIAFLYRSSFQLINSTFEDFGSSSVIFGGENVNLTLDRVTIKNASSPLGFSRFKERSQLTITHCIFSRYQSATDEGFYQDTGTLSITNSAFFSFNAVFFQARSCSVFISHSVFQEGRSKALSRMGASAYGGALACTDCPSVVVENSSFLNVSAIFGGAVAVRLSTALESLSLRIISCEFIMCAATAGGAVYVNESSLYIEGSRFVGNDAVLTGGAVDVSNPKESTTTIRNCVFHRNSANEGGAVKWSQAEVMFINVSFQDNSAIYGPDIASYGVKLSGSVSSWTGSEASGYPLQLVFELQDHYGQRVVTAQTQDLQLSPSEQVNFLGNTATTIDHGVFNFSELTIYAQPNSTQVVSGAMSTYLSRELLPISASLRIHFRDCVPGEVRKADRCEYCPAGKASFFPTDSNCSYCPHHAFCPGGSALLVDSHYWRNSTNSSDIVPCPMKVNCLGGQHSECAEGYTGRACNECSEHFTRHRTLECESCGPLAIQWVKAFLVVVPIAGFHFAVKRASGIQYFILKQMINHVQLLSALCYVRVSYPVVLKYSLHSLSYISSLFITDLPISCLYPRESEYIKAIIGSATPLILCIAFVLLNLSNMKSAIVLCTSSMMFTSMISLVTQMPLLACQSVQSGVYLFVDMQQKCWQGKHLLLVKALVLPSTVLNVVLPFVLVSVMSITSPKKFDDFFPLWCSGMKWRCWDLSIYSAKVVLLSLVVVSIATGRLCQVTYCLAILIVVNVVVASTWSHSYIHWKLFFLAEFSLLIVALSMGLCAVFIYHTSTEDVASWAVNGVFLLLNASYLAVCFRLLKHPPNLKAESAIQVINPCEIPTPPNSIVDSFHRNQEHR